MIKRLLQVGIILAGFASMPSWGIAIVGGTYDGVDVGGLDNWLVTATGISGAQAEVDLINAAFGTTYTKDEMQEEDDVAYYLTNTANTFAADLTGFSEPGFFLVKNSTWTAVFENLVSLDFGVFTSCEDFLICQLDASDFNIPTDGYTISHITFKTGVTVPEPGMVALLAVGLIGMVAARRRMKV